MQDNGFEQSDADPCLFFKWRPKGIIIWLTWVDDNLIIAPPSIVDEEKDMMKQHFKCDDIGDLSEYIGCKIDRDRNKNSIRITQPVLVQSLEDKFELQTGTSPQTPAKPGTTMFKKEDEDKLCKEMHTKYRAGIGKLQYFVQNSRPDIRNVVRELSRQLFHPTMTHYRAMISMMHYVKITSYRGLLLNPFRQWDGINKDYEWTV